MPSEYVIICAIPINLPQINSLLGARRREDVAVRREFDAVDGGVLATQEHDGRLERRGSGLLVVLFLEGLEARARAGRRDTAARQSYRHFIIAAALFLGLDDAHPGLRCARVRRETALLYIAAMAYGSRFCDLFDGVELLAAHSDGKKAGLPLCSSVLHAASKLFCGSQIVLVFAVVSPASGWRRNSCS